MSLTRFLTVLVAIVVTALTVSADTLTVGYLTGGASQFGAVAIDYGVFKSLNLDVELVPFSSSPDALNALHSGKLDIAAGFGTAPPLIFISKGDDFVFIAGHMSGGHAIVGTPELAKHFKSFKDLIGKKVATARLYTPDVLLRGALVDNGISYDTEGKAQVQLVEARNGPQAWELLKSGKVDAAALVSNEVQLALAAGFKVLRWSVEILPDHPCCRVVVTRETLNSKRPELVRFLRAWILAERIKRDDPTGYINSYAKVANIDFAKAKATLFEPHTSQTADPNTNGIVKFWDYLKSIKYIDSNIDIHTHIDTSLYKEALDGLRKENPKDKFYQVLEKRYTAQNTPRT